ncbi:hypothetical protein Tco_0791756 [Tanacetum coccineum]
MEKLHSRNLRATQMIIENLPDRSTTSHPVLPKMSCKSRNGSIFQADFVVINLRVMIEAITFKVSQKTSRYSYNDAVSINRIDVIDVACEEYAQEVLGFSDSSTSGNPTPSLDPILFISSPSLTPFEELKIVKSSIDDPPASLSSRIYLLILTLHFWRVPINYRS